MVATSVLPQKESDMSYVVSVDLHRAALRSDGETSSWPEARLRKAILDYERFLRLAAEDITRPIAPTRDIDAIWHIHMLSPVAYHRDCVAMFGEILDHDGGFGKDATELPELVATFEDTSARWLEAFGEPLLVDAASGSVTKCWHNCQSRCHHACKSVRVGAAA